MNLLSAITGSARRTGASSAELKRLVRQMCYELVPIKSVDQAISDLPEGASVSVTCSPVKGISATLELCVRLLHRGHSVIPHLAARLVEGPEHAAKLAAWVKHHAVREVLIIGGDSENPKHYADAFSFMRDFLANDSGVQVAGFAAYPDGHALIETTKLRETLLAKQELLSSVGVKGLASTQMCFDAEKIRAWLGEEREAGFTVPVSLGVPGVVDRTKLMTMGLRLGVGASMRYLNKNRSSITQLFAPGGFDPTTIVEKMSPVAEQLGIVGIHSYTFNNIADTAKWQRAILDAKP